MGCDKTEQPKFSEVAVSPALMICSSASTAAAAAFPQNAAEAATKPLIDILVDIPIAAVLKVAEPAAKRLVHLNDHALQRFPGRASGLGAKTVFQFLKTLSARPVFLASKFISQKRKALRAGIHNPCLGRMQSETGISHPRLNHHQSRIGRFTGATQHHKVVCVTNHFDTGISQ